MSAGCCRQAIWLQTGYAVAGRLRGSVRRASGLVLTDCSSTEECVIHSFSEKRRLSSPVFAINNRSVTRPRGGVRVVYNTKECWYDSASDAADLKHMTIRTSGGENSRRLFIGFRGLAVAAAI